MLYLATKLYYRPNGIAIQKKKLKDSGISPMFELRTRILSPIFTWRMSLTIPMRNWEWNFTRGWKKLSAKDSSNKDSTNCEAGWSRKPLDGCTWKDHVIDRYERRTGNEQS